MLAKFLKTGFSKKLNPKTQKLDTTFYEEGFLTELRLFTLKFLYSRKYKIIFLILIFPKIRPVLVDIYRMDYFSAVDFFITISFVQEAM